MTLDQQRALQSAQVLAEQAKALEADNRWEQALPLRRNFTADLIAAFGAGSPEADKARRTVADSLSLLGRYPEAREVLVECLSARKAALGDGHHLIADALNRIGETHRREGQLTNALQFFAQAEAIVSSQPQQSELLATVLNNQALVMIAQGDAVQAEARWMLAIPLMTRAPEANALMVATLWTALGEAHRSMGRVREAESDQKRALALLVQAPPFAPQRLMAENNYASVLRDLGRTREAVILYERSIAGLEAQRGADDLDVLTQRRNLALTFAREERHAEALQIADEALGRLERNGRSDHPLFDAFQTDRGDYQTSLGNYLEARRTYETVVTRREKQSGANHPLAWAARERAAVIMMKQGDLSAARRAFEAVLDYRRQRAGDGPKRQEELASTLLEWVRFSFSLGRRDEAGRQLREAFEVLQKHPGLQHPLAAECWTEAGELARADGRLDEALTFHNKARQIRRETLGEKSLPHVRSQFDVAEILSRQGRSEAALKECQLAWDALTGLLPETSPVLAWARYQLALQLHRAGRTDEAATHIEAALGVFENYHSLNAAAVRRDLSFLEMDLGRMEASARNAAQASVRQEEFWQNVLRFASANDRLAWQGTYDVFSALASVAERDAVPLAQAVLRFKGAVLDSLIEDAQLDARAGRRAGITDAEPLRAARRELYRQEMRSPRQGPNEALRQAQERVERLESTLAGRVTALALNRRALSVTVPAVQSALPAHAALIEFVRYRHHLGRGRFEDRFGALVLSKSAPPQWIVLGPVEGNTGIRQAVMDWVETIHKASPPAGEQATQPLGRLYDLVWTKVADHLPKDTTAIIIAPDAELNFVSFAVLWKTGHFLGEDLDFRYVTSGRDLLLPAEPTPKERSVCILANPTYARSGWRRLVAEPIGNTWQAFCDVLALRGGSELDLPAGYKPLPGSASEADTLAKIARDHGCRPVQTWTALDANESNLEKAGAPYLLHFATHGTFLVNSNRSSAFSDGSKPSLGMVSQNPMHRSWVALARANETLEAWRTGAVPDPWNDGLLTAEEAAQLPLRGTWLVTLSACDTGLGVSQSGEGVLGLRRGFALAGARHVLMTLWPVDDVRTHEFMAMFYADALSTHDAPAALGRTQKRLLEKWRKDRNEGPGRAARFAGAFVISSQGR